MKTTRGKRARSLTTAGHFLGIIFVSRKSPAAVSPVWRDLADRFGETPRYLSQKWSAPGQDQIYDGIQAVLKLHDIDDYMSNIIHSDTYFQPVWESCHLNSQGCALLASNGGLCDDPDKEAFMLKFCAPACQKCHLLSKDTQCKYHENAPHLDALQPGDLDNMFENIVTNATLDGNYGPITVHSSPMDDGPWVVTFENVLSLEECERLIHYGHTIGGGFSGSKVRGNSTDIVNRGLMVSNRTSSTNWINYGALTDPVILRIQQKLGELTSYTFPEGNFEFIQVLRYMEQQKYDHHLDYYLSHGQKSHGHRALTIFLYLNDVEAGGETNFRNLNGNGKSVSITPKAGKVLVFPNVLSTFPNEKDTRTYHGSLAVEKGVKYGANAWVHQREYRRAKNFCKF